MPRSAEFRFYAELNDFLEPAGRGRDRLYHFDGRPAVKDAIEAQQVPHTEVAMILANGVAVGFGHHLCGGERVAVFPAFARFDVTGLAVTPARRRGEVAAGLRFVVDVNLGKLARWLRLLGFDTCYGNDIDDPELVRIAVRDRRVLLTRDRRLLHHKALAHGYWVRAVDPERQVAEVMNRFALRSAIRPFHRCLACNGLIDPVPKQRVAHRLEPGTRRHYDTFYQCRDCAKVYWKGPHFARLEDAVERMSAPALT
ncbi:MAG: Mut7-C RNAse domain-containing protein [Pseudomonadota bacterium]